MRPAAALDGSCGEVEALQGLQREKVNRPSAPIVPRARRPEHPRPSSETQFQPESNQNGLFRLSLEALATARPTRKMFIAGGVSCANRRKAQLSGRIGQSVTLGLLSGRAGSARVTCENPEQWALNARGPGHGGQYEAHEDLLSDCFTQRVVLDSSVRFVGVCCPPGSRGSRSDVGAGVVAYDSSTPMQVTKTTVFAHPFPGCLFVLMRGSEDVHGVKTARLWTGSPRGAHPEAQTPVKRVFSRIAPPSGAKTPVFRHTLFG